MVAYLASPSSASGGDFGHGLLGALFVITSIVSRSALSLCVLLCQKVPGNQNSRSRTDGNGAGLSLKQSGVAVAVNEPVKRMVCQIGLRVEVPGRQPYDVTIRQGFVPWEMGRVQPGRTVPV